MSSGLGAHGSTGRCFLFWNAYSKCLRSATVPHKDCILERDDYMECLYHRKLVGEWHHLMCIYRRFKVVAENPLHGPGRERKGAQSETRTAGSDGRGRYTKYASSLFIRSVLRWHSLLRSTARRCQSLKYIADN